MKPPRPLPTVRPFLSFYTPTFHRPRALEACLASVAKQTVVEEIEHVVVPDHVGYGVPAGLYGRLPWYAPALRGQYINILADDDTLAAESVVATVKAFATKRHNPPVIVTRVRKGALLLPGCHPEGEPVCGQVDLTSYIVRADVWHAHLADYGLRYEGDWDHATALYKAGHAFAFCDVLWAVGSQSNGRPEA